MQDVSTTMLYVLNDEMVEMVEQLQVVELCEMVETVETVDKLQFDIHIQIVCEIQMFHDELVEHELHHELIDAHDGKQ